MTILIRMAHASKISPNGYEVVAAKKNAVYQVPDELGRVLVDGKDAVQIDPGSLREALPRAAILTGRPAATAQ